MWYPEIILPGFFARRSVNRSMVKMKNKRICFACLRRANLQVGRIAFEKGRAADGGYSLCVKGRLIIVMRILLKEKGQREKSYSYFPRFSEHPVRECRLTTRSKYAVHPQAAAFLEGARPEGARKRPIFHIHLSRRLDEPPLPLFDTIKYSSHRIFRIFISPTFRDTKTKCSAPHTRVFQRLR
jgi:hypothetical protein